MVAVLFLNAAEQRELTIRTEVKLEAPDAGRVAIVDALGVLVVAVAARLPVAFENRSAAIVE